MAGRGSGGFVEQGVDVGGERGVGGPGLTDGEGGLIQLAGLGGEDGQGRTVGCDHVGAGGLFGKKSDRPRSVSSVRNVSRSTSTPRTSVLSMNV